MDNRKRIRRYIRKKFSKAAKIYPKIKINEDEYYCKYLNSEEDFESQKYGKLPDGTSIIWCFAGGDWEFPIHFAVYIDDKDHLRAYII